MIKQYFFQFLRNNNKQRQLFFKLPYFVFQKKMRIFAGKIKDPIGERT